MTDCVEHDVAIARAHKELGLLGVPAATAHRRDEAMLERTHIAEAPRWALQAVDKKRARLNHIANVLSQMPYHEIERPLVELPARVRHPTTTGSRRRRRWCCPRCTGHRGTASACPGRPLALAQPAARGAAHDGQPP